MTPSRRTRTLGIAFIAIVGMTSFGAASAQPPEGPPPAPKGWAYQAGAGAVAGPKTFGSSHLRVLPIPSIEAQYQDWFFANATRGIGLQTAVCGVTGSAALGIDMFNRDPKVDARLRGLNRVPETPALKLGLQGSVSVIDLSAELSTRLAAPGQRGSTLTFDVGSTFPIDFKNFNTFLGLGVAATVMDGRFADHIVAVSATEAARSRLPAYAAGSGLLDAGVYTQLIHNFSPRWTLFARAQFTELLGDARQSPVVDHTGSISAVTFVNYHWGG